MSTVAVIPCSHPELAYRWDVSLLDLPHSKPARFHIEPNSGRVVARVFFADPTGRRCCIDSRVMTTTTAIKLATRLSHQGIEVEVLKWWTPGNYCRPPSHTVHRVRRLDDVPPAILGEIA